jgi:hypothetical protein
MSELNKLTEEFERLLEGARGKHTLEEWRYAYRKILYAGGMKILEAFPEIIVGPVRGVAAGPTPPYHPSAITEYLCIVLGNCPPPPPQQS